MALIISAGQIKRRKENDQPPKRGKKNMKATAQDWIDTDKNICRKNVQRLGLEEATEYEMDGKG